MPIIEGPDRFRLPTGGSSDQNAAVSLKADIQPGENCAVSLNELTRIESVYVDNTRAAASLYMQFDGTQRQLVIPPGAEGCYYTFSGSNSFTISHSSAEFPVRARLRLFSCHQPIYERFPGAARPECPWDVRNISGSSVLGIAYTQPQPVGIGTGGWDTNLLQSGITISDSSVTAKKDIVTFAAIALPARMRHQKLRIGGKWYFELWDKTTYSYAKIGLFNSAQFNGVVANGVIANDFYFAYSSGYYSLFSGPTVLQQNIVDNSFTNAIGFAVDLDAKLVYFRSALGWALNGDPVNGKNGLSINMLTFPIGPGVASDGKTGTFLGSFGNARPFVYNVPQGFLAWNG